ncbi:MAG: hypothetical protein H6731_08215 [Myxococcales bacterium]|nr:MAG: hypothetical protein H6731_08215 [Myxococcales bacterium]
MKKIFINIFSMILAWLLASFVNGSVVLIGTMLIPLPEGVDISNLEALKQSITLFSAKHFIFPLLAHFIAVTIGAYVAARLLGSRTTIYAMGIGLIFFIGGIINSLMLPIPLWFIVSDLCCAYFPAAYLGLRLAKKCDENSKI